MFTVKYISALITFSIFMNVHAQNLINLRNYLDSLFSTLKCDYAVAFKMLDSESESILINEREYFHAASTMKTPVMIEVFRQANEGKFNLSDSIFVKNQFTSIADGSSYSLDISDDSGDELYQFIGRKRTIRELVFDMITVSSNLATNILIELVGAENVTRTMRNLGANDIKVLRGVEDGKAFSLGLNNVVTAFDLMIIYESLAEFRIINQAACTEMINILLDQKFNSRIPAKLPPQVKVAHKTGSITGVGHDSGIVFLPDGRRYILVLLSKNVEDETKTIEAQAIASKMIYDFVIGK